VRLEFTEWQSGDRFALAQNSALGSFDDLVGGSSTTITAFQSAEARTYYKRAVQAESDAKSTQTAYDSLLSSLRGCVTTTGRIRRKRLSELLQRHA
jgi:hypothetical protein